MSFRCVRGEASRSRITAGRVDLEAEKRKSAGVSKNAHTTTTSIVFILSFESATAPAYKGQIQRGNHDR